MLTVGDKEFELAPDAKIMSGAKAAPAADLTGKTVKVTYTVVDGKNVASMVRMPAAPKTERSRVSGPAVQRSSDPPPVMHGPPVSIRQRRAGGLSARVVTAFEGRFAVRAARRTPPRYLC